MTRRWLETVQAPDGDRVTFIIEPRLDRVFDAMDEVQGFTMIHAPLPPIGELLGRLYRGDRQRKLTKNAWLVRIESDTGRKKVLLAESESDAQELAASAARQVRAKGAAALDHLE